MKNPLQIHVFLHRVVQIAYVESLKIELFVLVNQIFMELHQIVGLNVWSILIAHVISRVNDTSARILVKEHVVAMQFVAL